MKKDLALLALAVALVCACAVPSSPTPATTTTPGATPSAAPAMFQRFRSAVTVTVAGTQVVLRSTGLPDHKSPYWGAGNALYEAPLPGMMLAPNTIASQNFTLRVPIASTIATASDTPLGPIGMAINGVAIFNQYADGAFAARRRDSDVRPLQWPPAADGPVALPRRAAPHRGCPDARGRDVTRAANSSADAETAWA